MKMSSICAGAATALGFSALLAAAPTQAATLLSPGVSDVLIVYNGKGAVVFGVSALETGESASTIYKIPDQVTVPNSRGKGSHVFNTFNAGEYGKYTELTDATPGGGPVVSDVIGVYNTAPKGSPFVLHFGFKSGTDADPPDLSGGFIRFRTTGGVQQIETDQPIDVTKYLSNSLQIRGWTAMFQSSAAVPEPATWAMMLLGVAGLGAARRLDARLARRRASLAA
jgi:hypothetical protein